MERRRNRCLQLPVCSSRLDPRLCDSEYKANAHQHAQDDTL